MRISFEILPTNGIHLNTALSGPEDGNPVVLLHGFPEAWFGWEAQIGPLAEAGFRVIVPDQRGYNLSDKPQGVSNYQIDTLALDILSMPIRIWKFLKAQCKIWVSDFYKVINPKS